jgi:DNA modification methylase
MATFEANSVDAIVTDPPYSLAFMGKTWDKGFGHEPWAREAFRVAKPGAYLLAFGGTRTSHRLAAAIEDAGWEIRDTLVWAYASGFPKSLDVSKAIDKMAERNIDVERRIRAVGEVIRRYREAKGLTSQEVSQAVVGTPSGACWNWENVQLPGLEKWPAIKAALAIPDEFDALLEGDRSRFIAAEREVIGSKALTKTNPYQMEDGHAGTVSVTAPATPDAAKWAGWGTALKPAWEPIVMARKPLVGTVAANVLRYGTGALNIDATRIPFDAPPPDREQRQHAATAGMSGLGDSGYAPDHVQPLFDQRGRWPANVILTDPIFDGGVEGVVGGGEANRWFSAPRDGDGKARDGVVFTEHRGDGVGYGDSGTYSRFFLIPKADRADREPIEQAGHRRRYASPATGATSPAAKDSGRRDVQPARLNTHPTVKSTDLMRHLVRLVTPPGGTVLDPFLGSGTTALAAELEGFPWLGIEREAEYVAIAEARLNGTQRGLGLSA